MKPLPIATMAGSWAFISPSNCASCGRISAIRVSSASGAVSFAMVSANSARLSSVISSSLSSDIQRVLASSRRAGGTEDSTRPLKSLLRNSWTDCMTAASGVPPPASTATGEPASSCELQAPATSASAPTKAKRVNEAGRNMGTLLADDVGNGQGMRNERRGSS
jgi:hypothetical protein